MNQRLVTLDKLSKLNKLFLASPTGNALHDMRIVLTSYLEQYPDDIFMRLKLIMIELFPPFEDYNTIEDHINNIFRYDHENIQALLILAHVQYIYCGQITQDLLLRLMHVKTHDTQLLSMINMAIAWYYELQNDVGMYEQFLLRSLQLDTEQSYGYRALARLYSKRGNKAEANLLIHQCLNNIKKIYDSTKSNDSDALYDILDIDAFFKENYKGIYITSENLSSIKKLIELNGRDC